MPSVFLLADFFSVSSKEYGSTMEGQLESHKKS